MGQTNELVVIMNNSGLEKPTAQTIQERFNGYMEQFDEWAKGALELQVTDESQVELMDEARKIRLALRDIRTSADKTRKELKEDSLRYGRAVQSVYNLIEGKIKPIEEHLLVQEKYAEVQEEKRREALRMAREKEIEPYREFVPYGMDYGVMSEDDFQKMIAGAKLQLKARQEEEAKAEAERVAMEKIDRLHRERKQSILNLWGYLAAEYMDANFGEWSAQKWNKLVAELNEMKAADDAERERMRADNERMKAENEAKEKALAEERAKAEAIEEKARKEREELEAKSQVQEKTLADLQHFYDTSKGLWATDKDPEEIANRVGNMNEKEAHDYLTTIMYQL